MGGVNERTPQTYAYKGSLPPHSAVARHHPQQRLRPGETNDRGGSAAAGPRGVGVNLTPVDKANLLFSFGVSDDAKASPALVEKFWGLKPTFTAHTASHFSAVPFGPAVALLLVELRRHSGWVPTIVEMNVTAGTGLLIATHPQLGTSFVHYGAHTPGPRWPRQIEKTRQLPPALIVATAFDLLPENVPADLQYLIRSPAEPALAA